MRPTTEDRTCSRRRRFHARTRAVEGLGLRLGAALLVVLAVGLVGCATAQAQQGARVRVLIYDAAAAVEIGAEAQPSQVALSAGQLSVNGETVGSHWSPSGNGPWRVGTRRVRGTIAVRASALLPGDLLDRAQPSMDGLRGVLEGRLQRDGRVHQPL